MMATLRLDFAPRFFEPLSVDPKSETLPKRFQKCCVKAAETRDRAKRINLGASANKRNLLGRSGLAGRCSVIEHTTFRRCFLADASLHAGRNCHPVN